jgi:hypothetical protein
MRELLIRFLPIVAQQLTLAFGQSSKIAMVLPAIFFSETW